MKSNIIRSTLKYTALALVLLVVIVVIYQSLYQSEIVASNIFQPVLVFNKHTAQLRGVKFNAKGNIISSSVDSTVRVWNSKGEVIHILKHPDAVTRIDVAANGNIVSGSYDGAVRLWNESGALMGEFGNGKPVWTVAFSPNGNIIASGGEDKIVHLWNAITAKHIRSLPGHTLNIWSVKFSPDGSYIASASFDATIKIWNMADGRLMKTIRGHSEAVVDIAFNSKGNILVSTSDDRTIKLWQMPEAKLIRTMEVKEHIQAAAFSPDDKFLLTAGRDKPMIGEFFQEVLGETIVNDGVSMRLWSVSDGKLLQTFTLHKNDVNNVDFSKDGKWIASGSEDKTVRLWHRK